MPTLNMRTKLAILNAVFGYAFFKCLSEETGPGETR